MQMSNLDFISRSELIAEIDNERKRHIDSGNYGAEHLMVHSLRRLVEEAPAVDAVPVVHGRWEHIANYGGGNCYGYCSVCGSEQKAANATALKMANKYCSNCGARMDKEAVNAQK